MVPALLCLIVGLVLAFQLPECAALLVCITAFSGLCAIVSSGLPIVASICLAMGLACAGAALGQAEFYRYPADDISAFSCAQPRLVQIELRIDEPPRLLNTAAGGRELPPRQNLIASVQRILTRNGWADASGRVLAQISHPDPLLNVGQRLRVLGWLGRPAHATNPGEFDWADHYRQQRILTSIRIPRIENIRILSDSGPGPIGWLRAQARDLLAMGFTNRQAQDHSLLRALVLGDDDAQMQQSQQQFMDIGAAFLLSISGMHIAVVAAVVYGLCRLLMTSPRAACWICLAVVILYGMVALPRLTALRAVVLCAAVIIGILSRRETDKLQLLAIIAFGLLLMHPMELFNPGFQLGLFCIAGLILMARPIMQWLATTHLQDDLATRPTRSASQMAWLLLRGWIVFSLVAWAVAVPIVAYHFQQFSPWAVPCGMALFSVVALALVGGCAKILLTLCYPSFAVIWAEAASVPVIGMRHIAAALAHLPAASVAVMPPARSAIAAYYSLLLLPLLPWRRQRLRRAASGLSAVAVFILVALLSLGWNSTPVTQSDGGLSITFLDIGAGQCAVVQSPHALPTLVDAGSSTVSDVTRTCLGPFLRRCGDRAIGAVFLSHSDYDHISAISTAIPIFGVDHVFTSPYFAHFASIDPPAQALLDQLHQAGKSPRLIQRGDHLQIGSEVVISVLWPPAHCDFNCNNTGLVLRMSCRGRTVLFPADIQADAMRELLRTPAQLKADVLVAAHHGSSEITTPAFVNAVDPQLIISSNGSPLTEKQTRFESMIGKRPLYRTSSCGAITLHILPGGQLSVNCCVRASSD
jgi:competence protein ComEC